MNQFIVYVSPFVALVATSLCIGLSFTLRHILSTELPHFLSRSEHEEVARWLRCRVAEMVGPELSGSAAICTALRSFVVHWTPPSVQLEASTEAEWRHDHRTMLVLRDCFRLVILRPNQPQSSERRE